MVSATAGRAVTFQRLLNGQDECLLVQRRLVRQHAAIRGDEKDTLCMAIVPSIVADGDHAHSLRQDSESRVISDAQAIPPWLAAAESSNPTRDARGTVSWVNAQGHKMQPVCADLAIERPKNLGQRPTLHCADGATPFISDFDHPEHPWRRER